MPDLSIVQFVVQGGSTGALVWLVIYVLRRNEKREDALVVEAKAREAALREEHKLREEKMQALFQRREDMLLAQLQACAAKMDGITLVLVKLERWLERTE